jgi:1-acyl-sn-glycerol-3-phosphate acyltransferase
MSIERKPSDFERKLLLTPIRKYLELKFQITVEKNETIGLKPPYLIVGNHVTDWDPLIINCYVDDSISFVAASQVFRHPLLEKVLNYTGAISKTKSRVDSSTIRNIIKAKKANRVIGIFPEGNRSWDGQTDELVFSTSKLIKSLKIPVVAATIKGGYLSTPRWAQSARQGEIRVSFEQIFNENELANLTNEEIHSKLNDALFHDEVAWQEQMNIEFKGKQLANYLERYLYACPNCHQIGKMYSNEDRFTCKACQYEVTYTKKGQFEQVTHPIKYRTIPTWGEWQKNLLDAKLSNGLEDIATVQELNNEIKFSKIHSDHKEELGTYKIQCTEKELRLTNLTNSIAIELNRIESVSLFKKLSMEFYYDGYFYQIHFLNDRAPVYFWYQMILLLKEKK